MWLMCCLGAVIGQVSSAEEKSEETLVDVIDSCPRQTIPASGNRKVRMDTEGISGEQKDTDTHTHTMWTNVLACLIITPTLMISHSNS